jgi:hypothetical protein
MWFKLIRTMAIQLCVRIDDYDVAYKVAELYVHGKITESTESAIVYHQDRLELHRVNLAWSRKFTCNETLKYYIEYVQGDGMAIRSSYWRTSAAAWGLTGLDKYKLSLCDKLDDLNYIPINVLKKLVR